MLNGVGKIDSKPKTEALKWCNQLKDKKISQPNSQKDEVEECRVEEKLIAINR